MHLHGQHFWISSREFDGQARDLLRDTYLMQPGERAEFLFLADNPGDRLFNCHMLEHHAAGLGALFGSLEIFSLMAPPFRLKRQPP